MADIYIQRKHGATLRAAREAADQVAKSMGAKYGVAYHWDDDVLRFDHPGVAGYIEVSPKQILLSAELGLLLRIFKASIEAEVHRQLDEIFGP